MSNLIPGTEAGPEREPANDFERFARAKWREGINDNGADGEFWVSWDAKLKARAEAADDAGRAILLNEIERTARDAKPQIAARRKLDKQVDAARRRFLSSGGSPEAWRHEEASIRTQILKQAALAGTTEDEAQRMRNWRSLIGA